MFDDKPKMMSIFHAHNPINLITTHVLRLSILNYKLAIYSIRRPIKKADHVQPHLP